MNLNRVVWPLRAAPPVWLACENAFSDEEIARIITHANSLKVERGIVGTGKTDTFEETALRSSDISWLLPTSETDWLYKKLTDVVLSINSTHFNFNLLGLEALQFSSYKADALGHYGRHIDTSPRDVARTNRKLSFTLQISDPSDYEGGDVLVYTAADMEPTPRTKAHMIFFPSIQTHEVTPVTRGVRQSLVGWVIGPEFN